MTQGKGEFSMEYLRHAPVLPNVQKECVTTHPASTYPVADMLAHSMIDDHLRFRKTA